MAMASVAAFRLLLGLALRFVDGRDDAVIVLGVLEIVLRHDPVATHDIRYYHTHTSGHDARVPLEPVPLRGR